jgi:protein-S-isoprenylcysteine O-methyltransferase Ste14
VAAIILSVIATPLLALAIWRWREIKWGGVMWLIAFAAMIAIRLPYSLRNRKNVIVLSRSDRVDLMLLVGMALSGGVLPLVYLASAAFTFADYDLPEWAIAAGGIMVLPALWLAWRSHADLDRNWSPSLELREGHNLVTYGIYRYVRHPMYAALWLWAVAQPILVHNWLAGALIVPAFAILYFIRTPREEAMMRERFSKAYDDYAARTGRLLPRFRSP